MGLFRATIEALHRGLSKTRSSLASPLASLRGRTIDQETIDELEHLLLTSDVGVTTTEAIIQELRGSVADGALKDKDIIKENGSIATMTYFGGEKCVPGYNVMGICKAALEATVRYLAYDFGSRGIKVNALSAGPLKTLAGSAAGVGEMLTMYQDIAPLCRNITHEEVGRSGAFLLSDFSSGITGEVLHIDGGYNAMGSPGRLLDKVRELQAGNQ